MSKSCVVSLRLLRQNRDVLDVVCAVIVREGRVLVCQRAEGKHLAGQWEFPGGKVEEGEAREAALEREIDEELGCRITVGEGIAPVDHHYPEVSIRLWPFLCEVAAGEPEAHEHAAVAWVSPGELADWPLAEADRKVAEALSARRRAGY